MTADGVAAADGSSDTYALVSNTENRAGMLKVTAVFGDGTAPVERLFAIGANQRFTIRGRQRFPEVVGKGYSFIIESIGATPVDIVVDHSTYFDMDGRVLGDGHDLAGLEDQVIGRRGRRVRRSRVARRAPAATLAPALLCAPAACDAPAAPPDGRDLGRELLAHQGRAARAAAAGFNALRLLVASGVFLILLAFTARTRPTRREWIQLAGLGLYGQFLYQLFFLNGMSRTSVANASLIIGLVPLVVALTNAALGLERLSRAYWIGIAVSVVGMYFVVGLDAGMSTTSLIGDALTFGAVLAWSAYTVAAKPLLARHSPDRRHRLVDGARHAVLPAVRDPRHARGRLAADQRRRLDRHQPVGAARAQPVLRAVEHRACSASAARRPPSTRT